MKHKILAAVSLITGLALSATAAYYSVIGLAAIFPASFKEVVIMGTILEIAKLVGVSWLYHNWDDAPMNIKWRTQVLFAHGRALDVPSGPPLTPRRIPLDALGLFGFGALP